MHSRQELGLQRDVPCGEDAAGSWGVTSFTEQTGPTKGDSLVS